jgi:amidase
VILGKTNLSEWANFRSTRSSSGWSSRGGQTKNPYDLHRNPCGSSSGSGAATAANLCAVAIGTETNGSVACPSSINGIVGIKPTVGLWSRSGIIPISVTQDTAGPMTRTLKDAVILLGALSGPDPNDAATSKSAPSDYLSFLDANGLKGKKIGIEKSFLKAHEGVDALLKEAMDLIKSQGAELIEVEMMEPLKKIEREEFTVLKYEFKDGLNRYLAASKSPMRSLADVIAFNKKNESSAMPYFKQEILESSEALGGLETKEYKDALQNIVTTARGHIDKLMKDHSLDAICGPTDGPSWCTDVINGDSFTGYGTYSPAAIAGYPSISIPMGAVFGLPVGLCFIGKPWGEGDLIKVAYGYEQASKKRTSPEFKDDIV